MCDILLVSVAAGEEAGLKPLLSSELVLRPVHALKGLLRFLPPIQALFHVRHAREDACSCGLYAPPEALDEPSADASAQQSLDAVREKYRKRGWSQAKIDRAMASHTSGFDRAPAEPPWIGLEPALGRALADFRMETPFLYLYVYEAENAPPIPVDRVLARKQIKTHRLRNGTAAFEPQTLVEVIK